MPAKPNRRQTKRQRERMLRLLQHQGPRPLTRMLRLKPRPLPLRHRRRRRHPLVRQRQRPAHHLLRLKQHRLRPPPKARHRRQRHRPPPLRRIRLSLLCRRDLQAVARCNRCLDSGHQDCQVIRVQATRRSERPPDTGLGVLRAGQEPLCQCRAGPAQCLLMGRLEGLL